MLGFDALDKLFNKPSLIVDQAQCLNNRHTGAGCTACIEVCPADALAYRGVAAGAVNRESLSERDEAAAPSDDGLQVDLEGCLGCGVCVGACPTNALKVSVPDPNTLLTKVKGKPAVVLACPKSEAEGALQVPCLAALDADLLLLMGLMGVREVALDDRPCDGCEFKAADLVRRLPREAKPLAKAFEIEIGVRLASRGKPLPRVSADKGGEVIARRELFTLWRRSAGEVADLLTEDLVFLNNARSRGLKHRVSAKRLKLLELLRQRGAASAAAGSAGRSEAPALPVGPTVGAPLRIRADGCDACGLCVAICPTGAIIQHRGDDGKIQLSETLAHCLDCGLCLATCPHQAISREEQVSPAEWISSTPRVLVEVQAGLCGKCGKVFTPSPMAPESRVLCLQCSTEQDLLDELFGGKPAV